MSKQGFIYMLTNRNHTVLYIGVTSNLEGRIYEHKTNYYPASFCSHYNVHKLVYYEDYDDIYNAICREKQLKKWSRLNKEKLINSFNPKWKDLYDSLWS